MNRIFAPQPVASPETQEPTRPVASVAVAPENVPEPLPMIIPAPPEIFEGGDEGHYAQHWGINE
jgi:hypothetical protein